MNKRGKMPAPTGTTPAEAAGTINYEVVAATRDRYVRAYEQLTGETF